MKKLNKGLMITCLVALMQAGIAKAADHTEAPGSTADRASDIADLFIFDPDDTTGRLVVVLTYGGDSSFNPQTGDQDFYCDRDVLYSVHIDDTGITNTGNSYETAIPDVTMHIRMASSSSGDCDIRFENVPGAGDIFEGTVGSGTDIIQSTNGLNGFVGSINDPFFFDFQGFADTISTGDLAFDNTRDAFAGRNLSAIVFEIDEAALGSNAVGSNTFRIWATTARIVE